MLTAIRARRVLLEGRPHVLLTIPLRRDPVVRRLSAAELAVARALVTGASNVHIAEARRTSVRTVANQVRRVFEKLSVGSRSDMIARFGDVDLGPWDSDR